MTAHPLISRIDHARGRGARAFAADPHAATLETFAHRLTDRYWSETVWRSGLISQAALDTVVRHLEQLRLTLHRMDVQTARKERLA